MLNTDTAGGIKFDGFKVSYVDKERGYDVVQGGYDNVKIGYDNVKIGYFKWKIW